MKEPFEVRLLRWVEEGHPMNVGEGKTLSHENGRYYLEKGGAKKKKLTRKRALNLLRVMIGGWRIRKEGE